MAAGQPELDNPTDYVVIVWMVEDHEVEPCAWAAVPDRRAKLLAEPGDGHLPVPSGIAPRAVDCRMRANS